MRRRTLIKGAAWSIPGVATAVAVPSATASVACTPGSRRVTSFEQSTMVTIPACATNVTFEIGGGGGGGGGSGNAWVQGFSTGAGGDADQSGDVGYNPGVSATGGAAGSGGSGGAGGSGNGGSGAPGASAGGTSGGDGGTGIATANAYSGGSGGGSYVPAGAVKSLAGNGGKAGEEPVPAGNGWILIRWT